MRYLILAPRLDVPFKKSAVPKERGPVPPIRQHWVNFVNTMSHQLSTDGNDIYLIELPLWQFTVKMVEGFFESAYNEGLKPGEFCVMIPHKQKEQFDCGDLNVAYYMQMVFPWLFQIDEQGWCAGASVYPIKPKKHESYPHYAYLKKRAESGESKFDQPKQVQSKESKEPYILFPCQIPHDQTIMYHSDVEVAEALETTIQFAKERKIPLIVKGHPVNPGSMAPLKKLWESHNYGEWVDNVNINQLLRECDSVVTVNSGVGMEALLHDKPVFTMGRADYDSVAHKSLVDFTWENRHVKIQHYKDFIETYYNMMFDTSLEIENE